jgi:YggT family protein
LLQALATILVLIFQALTWVVFIHVLLSWVLSPDHPIRRALGQVVEPLLQPIRNLLPQTGMIDLSPMVLLIVFQLLQQLIARTFL